MSSNLSKLNFIIYYSFILILQNNSSHWTINKVKCEKRILPSMGLKPTTSCIRGNRLPAGIQVPNCKILKGRDSPTVDIEIYNKRKKEIVAKQ